MSSFGEWFLGDNCDNATNGFTNVVCEIQARNPIMGLFRGGPVELVNRTGQNVGDAARTVTKSLTKAAANVAGEAAKGFGEGLFGPGGLSTPLLVGGGILLLVVLLK